MRYRRTILRCVSLLVLLILLLTSTGCGDDRGFYDPVKSSSLERTVVAKSDGVEVNYELIRFLFLSRKSSYDAGNEEYWTKEHFDAAMRDVLREAFSFYATFEVAKRWGIDSESDAIDDLVNEYVKADVEGGTVSGREVAGYGSHEAYLEALKKRNSTDAVNRLLYRYSATLSELYTYVCVLGADGKTKASDEELSAFLAGEGCAHINRIYIPFAAYDGNRAEARARALELRDKLIADKTDYDKLKRTVFCWSYADAESMLPDDSIENGLFFGKYSTAKDDSALYDAIFSIGEGEVGDLIETDTGCYVFFGMSKDASLLGNASVRDSVLRLFFEEKYSREMDERAGELLAGATFKSKWDELSVSSLREGV